MVDADRKPHDAGDVRLESARLLGAHMPTAGGLHKGISGGHEIGCTAVQVFTASPRQWSHPPLSDEAAAAFLGACDETGISFVAAHDSYLINLAAPADDLLERSRAAFRSELDRAERLGMAWVVTHMGAHVNQGEEQAVARLIASLVSILEATDGEGYRVGIALETTAGQGTGLGATFDQLGEVLRGVGRSPRLGVCLDTCHVFVAGYDLREEAAYQATWAAFDALIGREHLKLIHANDAKKALGSRVDRHAHIGEGEIGMAAFARLVADPRLSHVPIVVETPDADTMHAVNVSRLRRMAAGEPPAFQVTIQLFGRYSEVDGVTELTMPLDSTLRHAVDRIVAHDARLADIQAVCRFAVDEEFAELDTPLRPGCAVAVMPPMSGG